MLQTRIHVLLMLLSLLLLLLMPGLPLGFFTFHQIGAKILPNGRRLHQMPFFHWISADLVPRFPRMRAGEIWV